MPDLEPGDPQWWLKRLERRLSDQRKENAIYRRYYDGDHDLKFATLKFRQAFGDLFEHFSDNWCPLVVDSVEERLTVEGFRFDPDDPESDKDAAVIWQRNQMDAESILAHQDALIAARSYALVWGDGTSDPLAVITIESDDEMAIERAAGGSRWDVAAAAKFWVDDWTGRRMATLYLPDRILKYQSTAKTPTGTFTASWEPRTDQEDSSIPNPLGRVPVIPFENRPRLRVPGRSELHNMIGIQDAVNKLCADLLLASEFSAFRQKWATGLEIPIDPETKNPIEPFESAVSRLWATASQDVQFGEFSETNLQNYVAAVEMYVQHAASQTRTPPHYFFLRGEFPSGESIKSAETGLVAKTLRKCVFFGESWEEVMRLAFAVEGDDARAGAFEAETLWRDPEYRTEGEHVDAIVKLNSIGYPFEAAMEDLGISPARLRRILKMRNDEDARAALAFDMAAFGQGGGPVPPEPGLNAPGEPATV